MHQLAQVDHAGSVAAASLFDGARAEVERHKWIESEKAGRDLGEAAVREWSERHWWGWVRACWVEHLHGQRRWVELDADDFGLLRHPIHPDQRLVAFIVERIKAGGENLDIILAAYAEGYDIDATLEILARLDINSARRSFRLG